MNASMGIQAREMEMEMAVERDEYRRRLGEEEFADTIWYHEGVIIYLLELGLPWPWP